MQNSFEFQVLTNSTFCAILIFEAVREFTSRSATNREMGFELSYLILPLCLSKETSDLIGNMNAPGIMSRALAESPQLPVGLNERVIKMASMTEEAIATARASELIGLELDKIKSVARLGLYPIRKTPTNFYHSRDSKQRISCAKRLGATFEELGSRTISQLLNIHW